MNAYEKLFVYTDGGARGNPGHAAVGVVITSQRSGRGEGVIVRLGRRIGETTNNVAEYQAVITALEYLLTHKLTARRIVFLLDSLLVASQLMGKYKIKQPYLRELADTAKRLQGRLKMPVTFTHISRAENEAADQLVNSALDSVDMVASD